MLSQMSQNTTVEIYDLVAMVTDYRKDATWQEGDNILILILENISDKMSHVVAFNLLRWLNSLNKADFGGFAARLWNST